MSSLAKLFNITLGCLSVITLAGLASFVSLSALEQYFVMTPISKLRTDNSPPPNYLLIKGERWMLYPTHDISIYTVTPNAVAVTICSERIIRYQQYEFEGAELREFIWHETMHAELCGRKKEDNKANWAFAIDGEEHDIVYPLSMAQISFMHDNPLFMKWMGNW